MKICEKVFTVAILKPVAIIGCYISAVLPTLAKLQLSWSDDYELTTRRHSTSSYTVSQKILTPVTFLNNLSKSGLVAVIFVNRLVFTLLHYYIKPACQLESSVRWILLAFLQHTDSHAVPAVVEHTVAY